MSYILDTDVAPFCHGQNHSGSVPITTGRETATLAPEVPLESLGSRETLTARHGRVCGPDHHHRPPGPRGTLDKFTFRRADRGVSCLPGHRGFRQEHRLEILDSDHLVAIHHPLRPDPRIVDGLPGGFLRQPRRLPLRRAITPRLRPAFAMASRHLPLSLRQLSGASLSMPEVRQIESRIGSSRRGGHTPIHTDTALTTHTLRQHEPSVAEGESAPRIRQRRQGSLARLHLRTTTALVLMDGLVPQPTTPAPLGQQHRLSGASRPQTVRIPHHFIHSNVLSKGIVMRPIRHSRLFLSAVNDGMSKAES